MRKLVFVSLLLALATACPKVERKVYTFDLKAGTGRVVFENIVTDDPTKADGDFMEIVDKVIKGTEIEEDHPGWNVGNKELFVNDGRLDGKVEFTFADRRAAGVYQHDKKSAIIWCSSRENSEKILSTNGTPIAELPGCIAWDRKATELSVTVEASALMGNEQPLLDSFQRWKNGEKLVANPDPMEGFGTALLDGMSEGVAEGADLTLGPAAVEGADAKMAALLEGEPTSALRFCVAQTAPMRKAFTETVHIAVQPDGSHAVEVVDAATPDPARTDCYTKALEKVPFPKAEAAWSMKIPAGIAFAP